MKDWLIDDDRLPLSRKSLLPGEGFFHPDSFEAQQEEQEAKDALDGAAAVAVADPDADGLGSVALVRVAHGDVSLLPTGPHEIEDTFEYLAEYLKAGADLFVCDLCPDSEYDIQYLPEVAERAGSVRWFDHHQWNPDLAARVEAAGVDLVVGESEEECTTDVALRSLEFDFAETYADLAAVTRDHDLWLREDPRSDDLADYAYWSEPEEYAETVQEHGADLPEEVAEFLAEQRVEKEALIELAVDRGTVHEIGPWSVAVTYGRCSQNEVAEAFREQGADAAVIVKPAGSASIRGTEGFARCHEVAAQVNGGGHPKAAGCKPNIYEDMLDYANHWTTQGAVTKQVILEAFRRLDFGADEGLETEL
jgi:oligoribonuclease NrnB/cAMP/cGMP phosphodiesterase (DHH superfamily)